MSRTKGHARQSLPRVLRSSSGSPVKEPETTRGHPTRPKGKLCEGLPWILLVESKTMKHQTKKILSLFLSTFTVALVGCDAESQLEAVSLEEVSVLDNGDSNDSVLAAGEEIEEIDELDENDQEGPNVQEDAQEVLERDSLELQPKVAPRKDVRIVDPSQAPAERDEDSEEEYQRFLQLQIEKNAESEAVADSERAQDSQDFNGWSGIESIHRSGSIRHGGTLTEVQRYYTRGGRCTSGYVRSDYTHSHIHHGWGHIVGWASPNDPTDCRVRIWLKNSAMFVKGVLYWTTYEKPLRNGHYDYCQVFGDCGIGEGDCDSDRECASGLTCEHDVGGEYGFKSDVDVCTNKLEPGHPDFCTPQNPCEPGHGDCDSDAECLGDYGCGEDNGADYGFESWVDVCRGPKRR